MDHFFILVQFNSFYSMIPTSLGPLLPHGFKACVIGGGFAGLATCNFLLDQCPSISITLFDKEKGPGINGASVVAGGLMHPFTPKAKLIWKGIEGFELSSSLMLSAQQYIDQPIYQEKPILRPSYKIDDYNRWQEAVIEYPAMVESVSKEEVERITCTQGTLGGVKLLKSLLVHPSVYLSALWNRVTSLSPTSAWTHKHLAKDELNHLSKEFDVVVVTSGPGVYNLWSDSKQQLPFKFVRGQNLIYNYQPSSDPISSQNRPDNSNIKVDSIKGDSFMENQPSHHPVPNLDIALLRGEYIVPSFHNPTQLVCGATHEYEVSIEKIPTDPSPIEAYNLLQPKLSTLYPPLFSNNYKLESVNAGIRVMSERSNLGKIPLISVHSEYSNVWLLAGLGARGLIHHAYMAKTLVKCISETIDSTNVSQKLESIPKDIQL